ncbi:MAG TPA: hypothetical protein PLR90_09165 [Methylophilus sp.]|nr:hypothetical protein [Methylophilus sp.]
MLNAFYIRPLLLAALCAVLCGCLGGTVAQQVARSIATSVADKAVAKAMDVDERPNDSDVSNDSTTATISGNPFASKSETGMPKTAAEIYPQLPKMPSLETLASHSRTPTQDEIDEFNERYVFATSGFRPVEANPEKTADAKTLHATTQPDKAPEVLAESRPLVSVEVLNFLPAEEKKAMYEKARLLGALNLPQEREWPRWHVAMGRIDTDNKLITFLIPPQMGKLRSGSRTVVELANIGDLNIARY